MKRMLVSFLRTRLDHFLLQVEELLRLLDFVHSEIGVADVVQALNVILGAARSRG